MFREIIMNMSTKKIIMKCILVLIATNNAMTVAVDVASGPYSMDKLINQLESNKGITNGTVTQRVNFDAAPSDTGSFNQFLSDYVSKSVFDFGHDIGVSLLQSRPDNKFEIFSPVSIVAALNLVLLGAKGNTFDELLSVLKYGSNSALFQEPVKIHEEFSQLLKEISNGNPRPRPQLPWKDAFFNPSESYRDNYAHRFESGHTENGKINIANGIFVQSGYTIRESYTNVAQNLYNCEIKNLDFFGDPSGSARYINNWINSQTRGLVPKIVGDNVAPETRAIIANSLYFKSFWHNEFLDGATGMKPFYPNGLQNPSITVEMMANAGRFPFYESLELDCRVMALPYKLNQTTMYIFLPNNSTKQKLMKLQNDLTADRLDYILGRMEMKRSIILFPKLHLTSQANLRDVLMGLGARSIFSPRLSDLSLMANPDSNSPNKVQSPGITSGRVTSGITSGKVERLTMDPNMDSLHDQLIFSRVSDDNSDNERQKREVTYKVQSKNSPLKFKDFILNKRIPKSNPENTKKNRKTRRNRRNVSDSNPFLQELERLRYNANIRNPGLYADDVLHKVNLIVNEKGTEAGAATAVTINRSGPQVLFRVETPFLILIRHDDTKLPLFYGSVFEPVSF
uniref:CSON002129 protein n=1 Tax=Culicoides sonorensis TaxID=179676 RepID=A0A336K6Z7_CULSO